MVIDEQHKFGVAQRLSLKSKGINPDILVMTATPIPRSLALTVYGDMDISTIDELPVGRKPVETYWISTDMRERVYKFIRRQVNKDRQVFIVYPLIEESEKLDLKAACFMYEKLKKDTFKDFSVGIAHGAMDAVARETVMENFRKGKIDILVSTVVIEVGIDIPGACVIVIENAERFGLAQLHQLRGRIGRGKYKSYCILISDSDKEEAKKRLSSLVNIKDGFKIAEEDLKLRGPGDFFGTRQHGFPDLRIGNILTDVKLLEKAKDEAFRLIKDDIYLSKPLNSKLRQALIDRFKDVNLKLFSA